MNEAQPQGRQSALAEELKQLADVVGPGPLVDLLLERAFEISATDIHFDPRDDGLHVRVRVDGILHDVLTIPSANTSQVVSRLKLMGGMDITERRVCQDGHVSSTALTHQRDVRIGSGPTIHGERIVLRLMPDDTRYTDLDDLGFEPTQLDLVGRALAAPHGMVLSVGPVGCGKSTTTYACLSVLTDPGSSLVTIEDPVERRMPGVNQIQADPKIGFGFVEALRGVLRQDPNVIMVGEIRDSETAHIAARAALTGIRVLSTLHASDTCATIDLFREFQVPRMFIADSINCIIAQRLVRRICETDREVYHPDAGTAEYLGLDPAQADNIDLYRGVPSPANFHTGYSGRTAIFEVMRVDGEFRDAVLQRKPAKELRDLAAQRGVQMLERSAINKVLAGVTTVEEMHRILVAP